MKSLAPGFLIAMPQLLDENFHQAVVLMIEHSGEGAMGLVINHEVPLTFRELGKSQAIEVAPGRLGAPLFQGGPVEPYRGFVLHDSTAVEERTELVPGLFLSVTSDALGPLLVDEATSLRFCLGYAGWGPGQLEHELKQGSWLFAEATAQAVLKDEPGQVWAQVIQGMGIDPARLVTTGGVN